MESIEHAAARLRAAGKSFCVATVVRSRAATAAKAGAKAIVAADGEIFGFIGGGCVAAAARRAAAAALAENAARLIRVKPGDEVFAAVDEDGVELHKSGCPSRGSIDLFIDPMHSPPLLAIFGSSPVAQDLAALAVCAGLRARLARGGGNLPAAVEIAVDSESLLGGIGARDFVVVATQGEGDLSALKNALASAAGYAAMVASPAKARFLRAALLESGVAAARVEALHAPAGIHIHAIEPAEIAISILAEIVRWRRAAARADS